MSKKVAFMQGNEAAAHGAIYAGCTFFAGYPITPSTEVAEVCSAELPKIGGKFIQMEDEIGAMAESILGDQKRVLPTCAYLQGEFGVKGYYVGVPCVLGEKGIEKIIEFKLDAEEQAMMDKSVAAVKSLVDSMK